MDDFRTCWSERIGMERNAIITAPATTAKEKWRLAVATITSRRISEEGERDSAVSASQSTCWASEESTPGGRDT